MTDITRQRNSRAAALGAVLLVFIAVFRFPVQFGMLRISMQVLFECLAVTVAAVLLWQFVNRFAALLLALCCVSMFYPFCGPQSYMAFHDVLFFMIWYGAIVTWGKGNKDLLLDGMCVISGAHLLFQVLQVLQIDPLYTRLTGWDTVGLMANPNEVSALHAFCFVAFLRPGFRRFLFIPVAGLLLSKSCGGLLAVTVGMLFYAWQKNRIIPALALSLLFTALYVLLIDAPGVERWPVWRKAWSMFQEHWALGSGIGHWKIVFQVKNQQGLGAYWDMAHNDFLQAAFELGIGFLIILAGYVWDVIRRRGPETLLPLTAAVIVGTNMMVGFPMHVAITAAIATAWLAILETTLIPRPTGDQVRTIRKHRTLY